MAIYKGNQLIAGRGEPGKAGESPHIGANGNWWVGETDTGVKAQGPSGGGFTLLWSGSQMIGGQWSVPDITSYNAFLIKVRAYIYGESGEPDSGIDAHMYILCNSLEYERFVTEGLIVGEIHLRRVFSETHDYRLSIGLRIVTEFEHTEGLTVVGGFAYVKTNQEESEIDATGFVDALEIWGVN